MAKLSKEDVLKLARLSRLRLSSEEVEKFSQELSGILDYVELLGTVDTTGLDPTYQVTGLTNVTREDQVSDYDTKVEALLKNVPALEKNQIKVKRVIG